MLPTQFVVDVLWRLLQWGKTNQIPLVWKWEVYVDLRAMGFLWGIELELHGIMCAKSQDCKTTYESHTSGDYFSLRQILGGETTSRRTCLAGQFLLTRLSSGWVWGTAVANLNWISCWVDPGQFKSIYIMQLSWISSNTKQWINRW